MVKRMNRIVRGISGGGGALRQACGSKAADDGEHQTTAVVELAMGAILADLSCLTTVVASSSQNFWHAGLSGRDSSAPRACSELVDAPASWSCPAMVASRSPLACDESGLPDAHALAMPTSNANIHAPSITMAVRRRVRGYAKRDMGCTNNDPPNITASERPGLALDQLPEARHLPPRASNATATDPRCRARRSSAP